MEQKQPNNKNLIINYIPQSLSDKELHSIFVTIGAIKQYKLMRDNKTGYSFGYGFVEYVNPDDSDKAIAQLNGLQVQNKRLKVAYARPPGQDVKDTNVYVQNLPRDIDENYLRKVFAPFGEIVNAHLLRDKYTGLLRGVGFVRFAKNEQARAAIESLNGIVPEGGTIALNVKVAENHTKKNQKKFMSDSSFMPGMATMGGMPPMGGMAAMGNMGGMGGMGAMGGMSGMGAMGSMGGMGDVGRMGGSGVPSLMGGMGMGYGGGGMGLAGAAPGMVPMMAPYGGTSGSMQQADGYDGSTAAPQRNSWQKASNLRPRNRFNPMGRAV